MRFSVLFQLKDIIRWNTTVFGWQCFFSVWPQLKTLPGENTCSYFTSCGLVTQLPFFKPFAEAAGVVSTEPAPLLCHPSPGAGASSSPTRDSHKCHCWSTRASKHWERLWGPNTKRQQQTVFLLTWISKQSKLSPAMLLRLIFKWRVHCLMLCQKPPFSGQDRSSTS